MLRSWLGAFARYCSAIQVDVEALRRDREGYKHAYEGLLSEVGALRRDCEGYRRDRAEVDVVLARLRDEREQYKTALEAASAELRRPHRSPAFSSVTSAQSETQTMSEPRTHGPTGSALRLLCVGTGRDGTTSLTRIFQDVFDSQGSGDVAKHEWASRELNMLFCDLRETRNGGIEEEIGALFRQCPYACVVGNGYAAVLPIVARILGDQVTLIHLRRRDRSACIASLAQNAELSPQNHLYYASSPLAEGKRLTAFHFGEMTKEQWDALGLLEKIGWYYDKTHSLVEEHKRLFERTLSVDTEDLSDEEVRLALARAAGADEAPRAYHVNRFVDLRSVPPERHSWVQRLLGELDVQRLAHDELYGIRHVLNEFVYQMSHFPDQAPGALDELRWLLWESHELLRNRMNDLQDLMKRVNSS